MNFREVKAAKINELNDGEMKSVPLGDGKEVLLTRINGNYNALGANCTHYGAPLADGVICKGVIMCPWHHACFDAVTGNLLEPPARDSLPVFETKVIDDDVIVMVPGQIPQSTLPRMVKGNLADKRNYVVIGGGAAGNAAAQALREAGYTGKIIMITKEDRYPYDRPNLSKAYLAGEAPPEWMPLRGEDFYREYDIDILFNNQVKKVNISNREILLHDNSKLKYDKILLAPGSVPRTLNIPGSHLKNIFYLRSFSDCDMIINAVKVASKAVIIGASFIGMETAHSLHERKADVTVIAPEEVPFKNIFGNDIGSLIKRLHEEHGIKFKLNSRVEGFEGDDSVNSVVQANGEKTECDFVVIGIGVIPATDFIDGINVEKDGSIKVNEYMKVSDDVFAAGDIAAFPYNGDFIRIEHWRVAEQQGRTAAFNMAGMKIKFEKYPFFWTEQAGLNIKYAGYTKQWDETVTWGNVGSKEFITFLIGGGKVLASIGNGRDTEIAAAEQLILNNKMPAPDELKRKALDLVKLASQIG